MENKNSIKYMVLASLFAALTAVGAYISIPIGPVPIIMSNLFVLMAGLLLGKKWAPASMAIYLLLGLIGLPVFSGAKSGLPVLLGPTGGYLFAYVVAAFVIALISDYREKSLIKDSIAVLVGIAVVYVIGVPWLKFNLSLSWTKAISVGMIPFLLGDILKGIVAVLVVKFLKPQVNG